MFQYTTRLIIGNDTATSVTTVEAETPVGAALETELKFPDTYVRVLCVELLGDCCWDAVDCSLDDHYCPTCERHLETDGECMNCHFA